MASRLLGLAVLTLSFLLAAVILWPASALSPWVEKFSNDHWRLANLEGSVWNGSGMLLTRSDKSDSWHIAQSIGWKLRWSDLWRGLIVVVATLDKGSLQMAISAEGLNFERLDASLPAPALLVLLPGALGRYGWGGNLHLRSDAFRCAWHAYSCEGEMELIWNDAEVAEIPGNKLGDYRFRLFGEKQALHVDLTTLGGRLQFNGVGEIAARGLRFSGEAAAVGRDAANLGAMLNTLGRRTRTPGKYLIEFREKGVTR
ncbi:MAG: type II secretion system protein N [Betaproteobacteria bacterium]|nr:type II secretion system protein N [Betaproteobacteria bacterium]